MLSIEVVCVVCQPDATRKCQSLYKVSYSRCSCLLHHSKGDCCQLHCVVNLHWTAVESTSRLPAGKQGHNEDVTVRWTMSSDKYLIRQDVRLRISSAFYVVLHGWFSRRLHSRLRANRSSTFRETELNRLIGSIQTYGSSIECWVLGKVHALQNNFEVNLESVYYRRTDCCSWRSGLLPSGRSLTRTRGKKLTLWH